MVHSQAYRTAVPATWYSFAKDRGPCLLLFICKGLWPLSSGIHLQRTVALVPWYSFAKDCSPCLCPAKTCGMVVPPPRACEKNSSFTNVALETAVSIVSISL